ncbi:efflux RND transporter periplasmic adaptor subunit [candidate division KSB1 bacterium]|nr:efflux RND transporter periplasmic adaptor subunit [candidate division KSB1 bacterium]
MKKYALRAILVIFVAFFLWRVISLVTRNKQGNTNRGGRPPVAVEIDSVRHGAIKEVQSFTGSVYAKYQYIVASKVTGRIIEIRKRIGDTVKNGELLARIDDAEYEQALREAEANLKISEASLTEAIGQFELAKQELERVQSLQAKGIASSSELDAALNNYNAQESRIKLSRAQIEGREAALQSARIRLSYTRLIASEPGFIGERYVDEGSLIAPNAPILSVIGIDTVIVRTTVIERVYGIIKVGQPCRVMVDAFPDRSFYGEVVRIAPMLQETSRVAEMEVEVTNDSLFLIPGMFAKVEVVLQERQRAQIVPNQSVVSFEGTSGVFIIAADKPVANFVPVQVGIASSDFTEIVSPELNGMVVTLGQHMLEHGSTVILPDRNDEESSDQGAKKEEAAS